MRLRANAIYQGNNAMFKHRIRIHHNEKTEPKMFGYFLYLTLQQKNQMQNISVRAYPCVSTEIKIF